MFRSLRWRLTLWFVLLSTIVYALYVLGGYFLFRIGLMSVIDDEIVALVSEIEPVISLKDGKPTLLEWAKTSKNQPFKFLPTIQLFDVNKQLIEQHGAPGLPKLFNEDIHESREDFAHPVRVFSTPLLSGKLMVGYLQIQLSLRSVDRAKAEFIETMLLVAPFLLVSLGVAGYIFSGKAVQPLEESFELLRRFMNDAGHELSTPISIIQANAEAMEVEIEPNHNAFSKLGIIARSTERMGTLVSDLMLLSRMESPKLSIKKSPIRLDQLVEAVIEDFEELFKAKEIELRIEKSQPLTVFGDSDALKRLLTNLLQNASRYTDAGGCVKAKVEVWGRFARLVIGDTGIGIPPESLPKLFDRFYRVDKSRSRAQGGVGLGLSIVKAIVDSHRGKIDVVSEVGKGTTFTILLPRH